MDRFARGSLGSHATAVEMKGAVGAVVGSRPIEGVSGLENVDATDDI